MEMPGFTAEVSLGIPRPYCGDYRFTQVTANVQAANHQITPQLALPIYGNYCGPGHGDPTGNMPPIDAVDAVCQTHDLCYDRRGYFDCQCDRDLIASMPSAIARTPTAVGKAAGVVVRAYFTSAPCLCRKRACAWIPFTGRRCITVPLPGRWNTC